MTFHRSSSSDARRRSRLPQAHTVLLLLGALALIPSACGDSPTDPGDNGDPNGDTPYAHDRSAGASAADLLSDADYEHLVVEVQYVEGMAPEQTALDDLADFLEARLTKPGGIEIRVDDAPIGPATGTTYSAADIRALEDEHREVFTSGDTLATYLLVVDGEYEQENVLGIAYYNTSTALFGEKIQDNTGSFGQPSKARVEATVAMHEFGHIMGLVDNGTDMVTEHKDPEAGRGSHCDDDGCLMYYAVRTTDFLSNLLDSAPPPLDQNCVDDLQANGGR